AQAVEASTGFEFGARFGFGLPFGSSSGDSGDDFNKLFNNMIPLWFDVGYRVTPHVYVGAYLMYGFGSLSTQLHDAGCGSSGISCDLHDTRFGGNVHYHPNLGGFVDPWIGAGFGYEWVGFDVSPSASVGAAITLAEFEHASANSGVMLIS